MPEILLFILPKVIPPDSPPRELPGILVEFLFGERLLRYWKAPGRSLLHQEMSLLLSVSTDFPDDYVPGETLTQGVGVGGEFNHMILKQIQEDLQVFDRGGVEMTAK